MSRFIRNKLVLAAAAAGTLSLALAGAGLASSAAQAAGCPAGQSCAPASVTVPQTFTFTLLTGTVPFTQEGESGGLPNQVDQVFWSVLTNDPNGYGVNFMGASDFINGSNAADTFPIGNLSVVTDSQNCPDYSCAAPVTQTETPSYATTTYTAGTTTGHENYFFPAALPNVPAGSYTALLAYEGIPS